MECATPLDFKRRLRLPVGSIYALPWDLSASVSSTVFRPKARVRGIKGLSLTGSSTHPVGGVPTTIASGIIACALFAENEQ